MNWGPIIGVIIGFVLGQVAAVVGKLVSANKERQRVRLLVALEVDQNLKLLNDYWHNVSLPPDEAEETRSDGPQETEADRLARRAIELPLPVLSERAFDSQLAAIPKAMGKAEIRSVWDFYEGLAQVKALHAWLSETSDASAGGEERFPSASRAIRSEGLLSATFTTKRAGAIFDLRKTIQGLLKKGNPITAVSLKSEQPN